MRIKAGFSSLGVHVCKSDLIDLPTCFAGSAKINFCRLTNLGAYRGFSLHALKASFRNGEKETALADVQAKDYSHPGTSIERNNRG